MARVSNSMIAFAVVGMVAVLGLGMLSWSSTNTGAWMVAPNLHNPYKNCMPLGEERCVPLGDGYVREFLVMCGPSGSHEEWRRMNPPRLYNSANCV